MLRNKSAVGALPVANFRCCNWHNLFYSRFFCKSIVSRGEFVETLHICSSEVGSEDKNIFRIKSFVFYNIYLALLGCSTQGELYILHHGPLSFYKSEG